MKHSLQIFAENYYFPVDKEQAFCYSKLKIHVEYAKQAKNVLFFLIKSKLKNHAKGEKTMEKIYLKDLTNVLNKIRFPRNMGGLTVAELDEIYGTHELDEILKLDVNTMVEKYRKWETGYRKGEILSTPDGHIGVVTYVNEKGEPHVLCENGMAKYYNNAKLVRLGKKLDIAAFLHEIKAAGVHVNDGTKTEEPNNIFVVKVKFADGEEEEINLTEFLQKLL